jgi:DNA-binding NtrC family response regulator
LAVFPVALPPLRERTEDIGILSAHFLAQLSAENDVPCKRLTAAALARLQSLRWDGNVRELQHAIERAHILAGNDLDLRVEHFRSSGENE